MTIFNPPIQSNDVLSGVQKYLLRVVLGQAGKTLLHRDRLAEIGETRDAIKQLHPLMEADLSESDARPFWVPRRPSDRKRFNTERRDTSRGHHASVGFVVSGVSRVNWKRSEEPTMKVASAPFASNFPSPSYLERLRTLGYPSVAVRAVQATTWLMGVSDRRANGIEFVDPLHPYIPGAAVRQTKTGGGFTQQQVLDGLRKMRTNLNTKKALLEIVYQRRSTLEVSDQFNVPVEMLYTYANRLRGHIRKTHPDEHADEPGDYEAVA